MLARYFAAVAIGTIVLSPAFAADPKPLVDEIIKPVLENKPYLGVAVGVVTPQGRHTYFFGAVKLAGKERPPDGETVFALGSLTKAYTCVLLADLVRDGKVK